MPRSDIPACYTYDVDYAGHGSDRTDYEPCEGCALCIAAMANTPDGVAFANPCDADKDGDAWRGRSARPFLFTSGTYGTTRVMAWSYSLERALEEAAAWLANNAPEHLIGHGSAELQTLVEEALEGNDDPTEQERDDAYTQATADLTYTESGYLTSYEWFVEEVQS